jgi:hypothetical protein
MDRVLTRRARRDIDSGRGGRSGARERLEANGQGQPGDLARKDDGQDERKGKTTVDSGSESHDPRITAPGRRLRGPVVPSAPGRWGTN